MRPHSFTYVKKSWNRFGVITIIAVCMKAIGMPIIVIFPTSAPIWMGFSTMPFMVMKD